MTDQVTRVVPAGWYQDPATSEQVRWWNGVAWTEHVREKPTPQPASGAETTEQRIAAARELERQFGIGTSENEIVTGANGLGHRATASAAVTQSQAATTPSSRPRAQSSRRAATGSSWLIALSPLLALLLAIASAYIYFYVTATPVVFIVAAVLPYLLVVLWALSDRRALKARGFDAPSPAFALLTALGYMIARRVRVPGSGPLIMFVVVAVLAYGSVPLAGAMGQLQGLANALNIQKTISADYIGKGQAVSVSCPAFVDATTTGTFYTCNATTAIGTVKTVWVSIDGTHGEFSYSLAVRG